MPHCCLHGTFLLQSSHICYYHQDLHQLRFDPGSRQPPPRPPTRRGITLAPTAECGCKTWAPSIFRASWFGRWVVTHSLADSDFHAHRPAVYINQYLLWDLMSINFGSLTLCSVHPASPVLLTKNGPLVTQHSVSGFRLSKSDLLPI